MKNDLLTDHKHFIEGLMRRFGVASLNDDDIEALPEPSKTWFKWAAGGFDRARDAYDLISRHVTATEKPRHLDIGCGPGYLSTVFASQGYESVGIDIGDLAQAGENVLDSPHLGLSFRNLDLTKEDTTSLGLFSVITVDNVMEHVESPTVLVSKLKQLLSPSGLVYLVIPNAQSISLFKSDPHYNQFGLALLDQKDGEAMLAALKMGPSYGVNNWFSKYDLNSYKALFAEYGFRAKLVNTLNESERLWLARTFDFPAIKAYCSDALQRLKTQLPPFLCDKLEYLTDLYLFELSNSFEFARTNTEFFEHSFVPRYLWSSWLIILKPAIGSSPVQDELNRGSRRMGTLKNLLRKKWWRPRPSGKLSHISWMRTG